MSGPSVIHHDKNMAHKWSGKWFGTNRGTHWTIAGSVVVIILGGYLIYSNRDGNPATATTTPAADQTPVPMAPAPLTSEK